MARPNELPVTVRVTTSGDTLLIAQQGSAQIIVRRVTLSNRGAALSPVFSLRGASASPARVSLRLAANGALVTLDFGETGWAIAPGAPFQANLFSAGDVDVNVTDWSIE